MKPTTPKTPDAVRDGERYVYIDSRVIKAPYGIVSMTEVLHACKFNLSGAAFGVYLYILCICSGRDQEYAPTGIEIGGLQIRRATGYSKASIYRALVALEKANLIEPMLKGRGRKYWRLLNPCGDDIADSLVDNLGATRQNESDIKKQVKSKNKAVNNLSITPVNNSILRQKPPQKSLNCETNTSNRELYNHLYKGGKKPPSYSESDVIFPYFSRFFSDAVASLENANSQDHGLLLSSLSKDRLESLEKGNIALVQSIDITIQEIEFRSINQLLEVWIHNPMIIADDLCNKRKGASQLWRWGWHGTQSQKKIVVMLEQWISHFESLNGKKKIEFLNKH